MRKKYDPAVYVAMRDGGLSNRRIAELLDVNEASVRRGLKKADRTTVVHHPAAHYVRQQDKPMHYTVEWVVSEVLDRLDALEAQFEPGAIITVPARRA